MLPLFIMAIENDTDRQFVAGLYQRHRDFLLRYRQVLRAGGEIHFKTDNVGLFAFSVTEFPLGGFYPEQVTHDLHAQGIQGIMTDYEEKFHNMGTKINRCVAVKGDLPPQPVPEVNTPEA